MHGEPTFVEAHLVAYLIALRLAELAAFLQPSHPAIPVHNMECEREHTSSAVMRMHADACNSCATCSMHSTSC